MTGKNPFHFSLRDVQTQSLLVMVTVILLICAISIVMLTSLSYTAEQPWTHRQLFFCGLGLCAMLFATLTPISVWSKLAYPIYGLCLLMLIIVNLKGSSSMGAERWLDLGFVRFQPSEFMKIALILAVARAFQQARINKTAPGIDLLKPIVLMGLPAALILLQPDLGTTILLLTTSIGMLFLAGIHKAYLGVVMVIGLIAAPFIWGELHDYQKERVIAFLNPEQDAKDSGYHIMQSKIALGSGGFFGKGYREGTQGHLNFLPEKHTDFIFTAFAEENGIVGTLALITLYGTVLFTSIMMSLSCQSIFARLLAGGVYINFFNAIFINIAMVTGMAPVVGVPLPLMSYGGSSMIAVLFSFGLLMSAYIHGRRPEY